MAEQRQIAVAEPVAEALRRPELAAEAAMSLVPAERELLPV
jgi:hypothetical protein